MKLVYERVRDSIEFGQVEDDTAAVALGPEEAGKTMCASDLEGRHTLRDRPDRPRLDLDRDLAGLAVLRELRLMLQAEIENRQSGGGVTHRAASHQRGRERQPVQAVASCCCCCGGALRDSSFSTIFIITDGVISACAFTTVR